jgi:hypothetical protein
MQQRILSKNCCTKWAANGCTNNFVPCAKEPWMGWSSSWTHLLPIPNNKVVPSISVHCIALAADDKPKHKYLVDNDWRLWLPFQYYADQESDKYASIFLFLGDDSAWLQLLHMLA